MNQSEIQEAIGNHVMHLESATDVAPPATDGWDGPGWYVRHDDRTVEKCADEEEAMAEAADAIERGDITTVDCN